MANIYSSGNPKDEIRQQIAPGSSDSTLADGLRAGSGIFVMTAAQFAAIPVKDFRAIYIVDGTILTNQGPQLLSITGTPAELSKGTAYSFIPTVSGGQGTKSYSLRGSLPQGLSFNSTTGEISGTPTSNASLGNVYILVKDDTGGSALGPLSFAPSLISVVVTRLSTAIGDFATRTIAGITYQTQSANTGATKPWTNRRYDGTDEFRFELRDGDTWSGDTNASPPRNRSEFQQTTAIPAVAGTDIWFSDTVAIDGNATSQANWVIFNQMHYGFTNANAVLITELVGDTLNIRTAWDDTTGTTNQRVETQWIDTNFIKNQYVRFVYRLRFGLNGAGLLQVWRDGVQIVDRPSINIGYLNDSRWAPYWKWGAYRRASTDTFAIRHVNVEGAQTNSLSDRINNPIALPTGFDLTAPLAKPTITRTFDGSVGTTYTVLGVTSPQWSWSDGTDIVGATSNTFIARQADSNKTLAVKEGGTIKAVATGRVTEAPILLWAADDMTGVTHNMPIAPVPDTTMKIQGAASLKTVGNGVSQGGYIQSPATATNYTANDLDVIAGAIILPDPPHFQTVTNYAIRAQIGASGYISDTFTGRALSQTSYGPSWISYNAKSSSTLVSAGSGQVSVRALPSQSGATSGSPYVAQPRIDAVAAKAGGEPTLCLSVDDGDRSIIQNFLPLTAARGIPVTHFLAMGKMGTQNFATMDEWKAAKALYGPLLQIGINGTAMDDDMVLGTPTNSRVGMNAVIDGLRGDIVTALGQGFILDELLHGCYPFGSARITPTVQRDQTAVFTLNSPLVTLSAANASILVGMTVATYGSPYNNKVKSISGTALELDLPVTVASGTRPISFVDDSGEFVIPKLPNLLKILGIRSMRATIGFSRQHSRWDLYDRWMILPGGSGSISAFIAEPDPATALLADLNAAKEDIKLNKATGYQYFHIFDDTNSSNLRTPVTATTIPYLDGLAADVQAGTLRMATHMDVWKRDYGSRMPF